MSLTLTTAEPVHLTVNLTTVVPAQYIEVIIGKVQRSLELINLNINPPLILTATIPVIGTATASHGGNLRDLRRPCPRNRGTWARRAWRTLWSAVNYSMQCS